MSGLKELDSKDSQLAILRTELANTRTMLSHTTASIGLLISGIAFMKLFDSYVILDICGWSFIFAALTVFLRGIVLYRKTKRIIRE